MYHSVHNNQDSSQTTEISRTQTDMYIIQIRDGKNDLILKINCFKFIKHIAYSDKKRKSIE
jgi:hypothetical protein